MKLAQQVRIVHLSAEELTALASGDLESARTLTGLPLTEYLVSEECRDVWALRADQLVAAPGDQAWVTGVLVDDRTGDVVGRAGFHAAPDGEGMVEVGYSVDPSYRRRGYARAALELAIGRARREPGVRVLRVTVSPDNAASIGLVEQYPFVRNGEQWDDEDGLELIWELDVF